MNPKAPRADVCPSCSIMHYGLEADLQQCSEHQDYLFVPRTAAVRDEAAVRGIRTKVRFGEPFNIRSFLEGSM